MNKALNRNLHCALAPSFLSRQNQPAVFPSKTQIVEQIQHSKDPISLISTHSSVHKLGISNDTFPINHLMNGYIRIKKIQDAHRLFDELSEPNVVSWTSLMAGYNNVGQPKRALWLFGCMARSPVVPNSFTFGTVVNACSLSADLETGRKIHAQVEIFGFQSDIVVCSALIDMYGKSNDVDGAERVFGSMGERNVVSWTSMITAYAQNGRGHDALELFRELNSLSIRPNHFLLCSVINACASLGRLVTGKVTHGAVIRKGHDSNEVVATALVDMYAKCGCLEYSNGVFNKIKNPSVITYTSMIVGAAKYGRVQLSFKLFQEMTERGVTPNDVTFLGVLHACSHSGLVDEGLEYLNSMCQKYGVVPSTKHYNCIVDMLGRVGRLDEAYRIAKSIHVKQDEGALLWGSLLSTSRLQGRLDIAVEASKWLIESNQQVAAAYVTMSNTYAEAGRWENARDTRSEMKRVGVSKEPGCSWVEIKDNTYVFYAGDVHSCPRGGEVVSFLRELEGRMKEMGYLGGSNGLVFVDVEEETKEEIVGLHSERLALGFALLSIPRGVTIRIMKNLRMCRDCHEAFKLISKIVQRDFVVRDVNRFHHFKDGSCTCREFW